MLQDIFDVSKAATGNITLMPEYIGLDKLLRQTLGDMDGVMNDSELTWRVQIPQEDFPVYADGQRMYRVFQNLIKNAAQYALEGSRVYVELQQQGQNAVVTIQNISNYELTMDGDSLTARFVRGDDSRSTSGSGLGLSIANSFTEACGGTFHVTAEGAGKGTAARNGRRREYSKRAGNQPRRAPRSFGADRKHRISGVFGTGKLKKLSI